MGAGMGAGGYGGGYGASALQGSYGGGYGEYKTIAPYIPTAVGETGSIQHLHG